MTIKEAILIVLWGLYVLWPAPSIACDCQEWSVRALRSVGIKIPSPEIIQTQEIKHSGEFSNGKIYVKDLSACRVILHESIHLAQWLRDGNAKTETEWWQREHDAAILTMYGVGNIGDCR